MARRPRFDQTKADLYLDALKAGGNEDQAAEHAGVDPDVIQSWREGRRSFAQAVLKVQSDLLVLSLARVRVAAKEDWRAADLIVRRLAGEAELARLKALTTDGPGGE